MSKGKKLTPQEVRNKMKSDKTLRRSLFADLCRHVERGYSLSCFPSLSDESIRTFIEAYPDEFNAEVLAQSLRTGQQNWEDIGYAQSKGTCLGNSRSWFLNMVNRYKWHDKVEVSAEHKGTVNVNVVNYASKRAPQHTVSNDTA